MTGKGADCGSANTAASKRDCPPGKPVLLGWSAEAGTMAMLVGVPGGAVGDEGAIGVEGDGAAV